MTTTSVHRGYYLRATLLLICVCALVSVADARGRGGGGGRGFGRGSVRALFGGGSSRTSGRRGAMAGGSDEGKSSGLTAQFIFLLIIIIVFGLAAVGLILKFIVYYCCYPDDDLDDYNEPDKNKTKASSTDAKTVKDKPMQSLTAHVSHEINEVRKKRRRLRSRSRSRKSEKRNRKPAPEPSAPQCESVEGQALLFQAIRYDTQASQGEHAATGADPEYISECRRLAFSENHDLIETVFGADYPPEHEVETVHELPSSEQLHRKRRHRRMSDSGAFYGDHHRFRSNTYHGAARAAMTPTMTVRQYSSPLPSAPSAEELGFTEEDFMQGPPTYAESLTHSTQSLTQSLRDTTSLHNFSTTDASS